MDEANLHADVVGAIDLDDLRPGIERVEKGVARGHRDAHGLGGLRLA